MPDFGGEINANQLEAAILKEQFLRDYSHSQQMSQYNGD